MRYGDRVKESTDTQGTGDLTLTGAEQGFLTFAQEIGEGEETTYLIEQAGGWELARGALDGNTLSRHTLKSSNGDSPLDLEGAALVTNVLDATQANDWVGVAAVKRPAVTSIEDGDTQVSLQPTIAGPPMSAVYSDDVRDVRRFQLQKAGEDWSNPVIDEQADADAFELEKVLETETEYEVRIADRIVRDALESRWSEVVSFATPDAGVDTPENLSPADGETDVEEPVVLEATDFSTTNFDDTHAQSQFQVFEVGASSTTYDSGAIEATTSHQIPLGTLEPNTDYEWRVRYSGEAFGWGEYSQKTSFDQAEPPQTYLIMSGWDTEVARKVNIDTMEVEAEFPADEIQFSAVSDDALFLSLGNSGEIKKVDLDTFEEAGVFNTPDSSAIYTLYYSQPTGYLFAGGESGVTFKIDPTDMSLAAESPAVDPGDEVTTIIGDDTHVYIAPWADSGDSHIHKYLISDMSFVARVADGEGTWEPALKMLVSDGFLYAADETSVQKIDTQEDEDDRLPVIGGEFGVNISESFRAVRFLIEDDYGHIYVGGKSNTFLQVKKDPFERADPDGFETDNYDAGDDKMAGVIDSEDGGIIHVVVASTPLARLNKDDVSTPEEEIFPWPFGDGVGLHEHNRKLYVTVDQGEVWEIDAEDYSELRVLDGDAEEFEYLNGTVQEVFKVQL